MDILAIPTPNSVDYLTATSPTCAHSAEMQPIGAPVVALTIVAPVAANCDKPKGLDVLLGVRRPESNRNHKNVVSVPTKRVPADVFSLILKHMDGRRADAQPAAHGYSLVRDTVEAIFARKLGMADALEFGHVEFSAFPSIAVAGTSPILSTGDDPESLRMINILVRLECGRALVPAATASYSSLGWFSVEEVIRRIESRDEFDFGSRLRHAHYLCGGLCICTAKVLLDALRGFNN